MSVDYLFYQNAIGKKIVHSFIHSFILET